MRCWYRAWRTNARGGRWVDGWPRLTQSAMDRRSARVVRVSSNARAGGAVGTSRRVPVTNTFDDGDGEGAGRGEGAGEPLTDDVAGVPRSATARGRAASGLA